MGVLRRASRISVTLEVAGKTGPPARLPLRAHYPRANLGVWTTCETSSTQTATATIRRTAASTQAPCGVGRALARADGAAMGER